MLRQLMLTRKIELLRADLESASTEGENLVERRAALQQREQELATAVEEINDESTEEERAVVEQETEKWTSDDDALRAEEEANAQRKADLQTQIDNLTQELETLNERAKAPVRVPENNNRKDEHTMNTRTFFGMNPEQRDAMFAREDVKTFLRNVRDARNEQRSITNVGVLIPDVLLPILRQIASQNSKMLKHVDVRVVPGTSRQNVMGDIPDGVWTEMAGKLNELSLTFYQDELDGFKVGGFYAVANSILEDATDVDLAGEILSAIGKAIGQALDKAILYGTGTKMPLGIVTRLAQTTEPSGYSTKARPWADLHTSNVVTIASTAKDAALYKAVVEATAVVVNKYADTGLFWAMNRKTYIKLMSASLSINAAGAIVAGQTMEMPVVGGAIEILDFIPNDNVILGYGKEYLLAERAGTQLATSEHYRFVEDQTVFKGTARYDGKPVIAEGFAVIGIGGTAPTTSNAVTFATDSANAT